MSDRKLDLIVIGILSAILIAAMLLGCRAMKNNPHLWLFATAGLHSPRGAETFAVGASVTLAWDPIPGVDGFRVYYRESGQNYLQYQDAGTNTFWRVTGLKRKTTYRFVATFYVGSFESQRSNEVSYRTAFSPSDR